MGLYQYLPILIFIGVAVAFSFVLLILSKLRGKKNSYKQKNAPYECGFEGFESPQANSRKPFDVQFYLVAILFIIFDLEIAFLFPWAVVFKNISCLGFWSMMIFIGVLTVGFIYEWRKGALEWH